MHLGSAERLQSALAVKFASLEPTWAAYRRHLNNGADAVTAYANERLLSTQQVFASAQTEQPADWGLAGNDAGLPDWQRALPALKKANAALEGMRRAEARAEAALQQLDALAREEALHGASDGARPGRTWRARDFSSSWGAIVAQVAQQTLVAAAALEELPELAFRHERDLIAHIAAWRYAPYLDSAHIDAEMGLWAFELRQSDDPSLGITR